MSNHHTSFTGTFLCIFFIIGLAGRSIGQHTNVPFGYPAYRAIERMELKSGNLRNGLFLDATPLSRININGHLSELDTTSLKLTQADRYWLNYMANDNLPWSGREFNNSKKPILKYFYESQANLYQAITPDSSFIVFINPVIGLSYGVESDSTNNRFRNTRGVEIRGMIDKKVGFYTYIGESQVAFPGYVQDFYKRWKAIPGEGYNKDFKGYARDFFTSRAYITFSPVRHIHLQFGNDQNFIGNGHRSLLLSNFAKDYLNLKVTTRLWRFQYQNIFAKFVDYPSRGLKPYPAKYGAFHYLTFDAAKWLNIGVFEGIIFHDNKNVGRTFELDYLNPVIFYRSIEQQLGSGDNALAGANINILPVKNVMLYGQLLLDEFRIHELVGQTGWAGNKYGLQAGAKWIDIFGLPNVDLQAEYNLVRPYTYSSDTSSKNYAHYGQPMAHPLGANLSEIVGILNMNSIGRLNVQLKYILAKQGQDSSAANLGSNIFLPYTSAPRDKGNELLQGELNTISFLQAWASYQLRHNLFLDLSLIIRSQMSAAADKNAIFAGAGLRLNFASPQYDF